MEPVPPERMPGLEPLAGAAAYERALDALIANAEHDVMLFDRRLGRDFDTPQRHAALRRLLLGRRTHRVRIVLHETGSLVRDCPRLLTLVRQFSHGLSIRQTLPAAQRVYDPFAIADEARFVHRFHHAGIRGEASIGDLAATRALIKRFEEIWQAAAPSVAAATTGL